MCDSRMWHFSTQYAHVYSVMSQTRDMEFNIDIPLNLFKMIIIIIAAEQTFVGLE